MRCDYEVSTIGKIASISTSHSFVLQSSLLLFVVHYFIEDSIDELRRLGGAEPLGQFHGLVDGHAGGVSECSNS